MSKNPTLSVSRRLALQIVPLNGAKCDPTAPAIGFSGLSRTLLEKVNPALVLSWLYTDDHDALDVAGRLDSLGFAGSFRVLTRPLPRPGMVRRELAAHCHGFQLELEQVTMPAGAPLHAYDAFVANPDMAAQDTGCLRLLA